jgi:hypothetical protein
MEDELREELAVWINTPDGDASEAITLKRASLALTQLSRRRELHNERRGATAPWRQGGGDDGDGGGDKRGGRGDGGDGRRSRWRRMLSRPGSYCTSSRILRGTGSRSAAIGSYLARRLSDNRFCSNIVSFRELSNPRLTVYPAKLELQQAQVEHVRVRRVVRVDEPKHVEWKG